MIRNDQRVLSRAQELVFAGRQPDIGKKND